MLIACLIAFPYVIAKIQFKNPRCSDVCMQNINYDLQYLIQILDASSNYLWIFFFTNTTLSDQYNDVKMAAEVKLDAFNRHQVRQLCCVKNDDLVID